MSLAAHWHAFHRGSHGLGHGAVAAGAALIAGMAITLLVVRPVARLVTSLDSETLGGARRTRLGFASFAAAFCIASFVFFEGWLSVEERASNLPLHVSELLLVLLVGYVVVEILLLFLADYLPRRRGRAPLSQFFKDVVRTLALLGLFFGGVKAAFPQTDLAQLVTTSAILSIVIGLALQESLGNVFSGLMLTVDEPYKPGDWIEIDGKEGKVLDSNWRSVRILTREDDVIYVPNSTMARSNVVNFSAPTPLHLLRRKLGVEYGAPPNKVKQVLVGLMSHVDGVLKDPPPDVFVLDYADFAIVYELRFWIDSYAARTRIESEVMRGVWYHLKRNGISIPFPIRDVYLRRDKPAQRPEEIVGLLKKVDILGALKDEELRMLADDLTTQLFARNETICRQGEEGSTFYIIRSGKVSVRVKAMTSADTEVAQLGPGAFFGEMSLLTGEPRSSTCQAAEDSELLCLDRESFAVLLKENPQIAQSMSEIIAARQAAKEKTLLERSTKVFAKVDAEERRTKIFDSIRAIFRFR
jgi:small-conductance mechanosensitive channel